MNKNSQSRLHSWAQLRFSIIGGLLASPPAPGELGTQIKILAGRSYQHPCKDALTTFGASTIERWYYKALNGVLVKHFHRLIPDTVRYRKASIFPASLTQTDV